MFVFLLHVLLNNSYFEWFSSSIDNICSLTLAAFFESFRRIAAHIRPVTITNILSDMTTSPIKKKHENFNQTNVSEKK